MFFEKKKIHPIIPRLRLKKEKSKEESKKSKLLSKILALDPSNRLYDALYSDLEGMLGEIEDYIANYDENIYKTELAIENATENQLTAEIVSKTMAIIIEKLDSLADEEKRLIMHYLLDSVQLYEKRQDNGWWVKSLRFKVIIDIGGQEFDEVEIVDTNSLPNENHDETTVMLQRRGDGPAH